MSPMMLLAAFSLFAFQVNQTSDGKSPTVVRGAKVVFFAPTTTERDSLVHTNGLETAEVLDDFDYYAGKASVYLNSQKIPVDFVTGPLILIAVEGGALRRYERASIPEPVGMILTDGIREPLLLPGIVTDEEFIAEIKRFFQLR